MAVRTITVCLSILALCVCGGFGAAARAGEAVEAEARRELFSLLKAARMKKSEARKLLLAAHAALDRADYGEAVESHKKAAPLETEVAALNRKAEAVVEKVVVALMPDLNSDEFEVRERGTVRLQTLGRFAAPVMRRLAAGKDPEVHTRLLSVAQRLEESEEDEEGRLRQWASSASASSEYSNPDWGANQATGKPDTVNGGDAQTAWATQNQDGGLEWLQLEYDVAVQPQMVRVHETFNPGAVVKIEALDIDGKWQTLWQGKDSTTACPGWLEVKTEPPAWFTKVIKITIDNDAAPGWNELDAVELIGEAPASREPPAPRPVK